MMGEEVEEEHLASIAGSAAGTTRWSVDQQNHYSSTLPDPVVDLHTVSEGVLAAQDPDETHLHRPVLVLEV